MTASLSQVFRRPGYVLLGLVAFAASLLFYLWSSQVISVGPGGVALLPEDTFISAAFLMALLFGLTLPVQIYAIRTAAAAASTAGGTLAGVIAGTASMSCCAPVVLPALLSLLGFSGTSIPGLNGLLHRYWLPLATLSVILLSYSLISTTSSLYARCELSSSRPDG